MAEKPTDVPVPQWAALVLDHFAAVNALGCALENEDPRLTEAERDLIEAVWLLLRGRFGRTKLEDPQRTARFLAQRAVRLLDEQDGQS